VAPPPKVAAAFNGLVDDGAVVPSPGVGAPPARATEESAAPALAAATATNAATVGWTSRDKETLARAEVASTAALTRSKAAAAAAASTAVTYTTTNMAAAHAAVAAAVAAARSGNDNGGDGGNTNAPGGGEVLINRYAYRVKPFYLSSETVLPIK
jgi:hypothetical protein